MNYGFGKTFQMPNAFTALNGTVQHYTIKASAEVVAADNASDIVKECAQANFLRLSETLARFGQAVIVKVDTDKKTVHFVLEQPKTMGKSGDIQVSKREASYEDEVKAVLAEVFAHVFALKVDGEEIVDDTASLLDSVVAVDDAFPGTGF